MLAELEKKTSVAFTVRPQLVQDGHITAQVCRNPVVDGKIAYGPPHVGTAKVIAL